MRPMLFLIGLLVFQDLGAAPGVEALTVTPGEDGEQTYTLTIQVVLVRECFALFTGNELSLAVHGSTR